MNKESLSQNCIYLYLANFTSFFSWRSLISCGCQQKQHNTNFLGRTRLLHWKQQSWMHSHCLKYYSSPSFFDNYYHQDFLNNQSCFLGLQTHFLASGFQSSLDDKDYPYLLHFVCRLYLLWEFDFFSFSQKIRLFSTCRFMNICDGSILIEIQHSPKIPLLILLQAHPSSNLLLFQISKASNLKLKRLSRLIYCPKNKFFLVFFNKTFFKLIFRFAFLIIKMIFQLQVAQPFQLVFQQFQRDFFIQIQMEKTLSLQKLKL